MVTAQEIKEVWQEEVTQEVPVEDMSVDTEAFEDACHKMLEHLICICRC